MRDRTVIGPWIRRFLLEHLVSDRNLTRNTQASYRDTLLLLLPFVSQAQKKPTDRLMIDDLSPSRLRSFLEYLEKERGCSGATRNLRLAAIHSLAKFIGMRSPEHVAWSTEIRAVPFKKTPKSSLTYLDKPEIDALLKAPDLRTPQGSRDYALLLFLYNTGARVEEAAHLTIDAITWSSSPAVRLVGKGNKTRSCPIWKRTPDMLKPLVAGRNTQEFVFLNRRDEPLTRFGIYSLVRRAADQASRTGFVSQTTFPSLRNGAQVATDSDSTEIPTTLESAIRYIPRSGLVQRTLFGTCHVRLLFMFYLPPPRCLTND